ncbi:hypothetical protein VIGAN_08271500, partial [Vigna angularis var. angularis]
AAALEKGVASSSLHGPATPIQQLAAHLAALSSSHVEESIMGLRCVLGEKEVHTEDNIKGITVLGWKEAAHAACHAKSPRVIEFSIGSSIRKLGGVHGNNFSVQQGYRDEGLHADSCWHMEAHGQMKFGTLQLQKKDLHAEKESTFHLSFWRRQQVVHFQNVAATHFGRAVLVSFSDVSRLEARGATDDKFMNTENGATNLFNPRQV